MPSFEGDICINLSGRSLEGQMHGYLGKEPSNHVQYNYLFGRHFLLWGEAASVDPLSVALIYRTSFLSSGPLSWTVLIA